MSVMILGGDRLGNIKNYLKDSGFDEITHVTGRKKGDVYFEIPNDIDLILVLTDFISHRFVANLKKKVKKNGMKVMYAKRSCVCIEESIRKFYDN